MEYFEDSDLFLLFIKLEKERLYKYAIFLSLFWIYVRSINEPRLLALPAPQNIIEEKQRTEDIDPSSASSIECVKEETKFENELSENKTLKQLEHLLQNGETKLDVPKISEGRSLEPNDLIIKNLISKFLKLYFKYKQSNLNFRAKSDADKVYGYYYWDKKQVARHLISKDYSKILGDKYDVQYSTGKKDDIPLALYFDLSDSMASYSSILAQIALALLNNNVKVLIGYNSIVNYQINSIAFNTSSEDLRDFFKTKKHSKINSENIGEALDIYLKKKKCERCIVFTDRDAYLAVCNLSQFCEVYLLYCLNYNHVVDEEFKGVYFNISSNNDLMEALYKMSKNNYRVLKSQIMLRERSK